MKEEGAEVKGASGALSYAFKHGTRSLILPRHGEDNAAADAVKQAGAEFDLEALDLP